MNGKKGLRSLRRLPPKLKIVGIDTNVFVYYFSEHPRFGKASKKIFDRLSDSSWRSVTSIISISEALSPKILTGEAAKEVESKFLDVPNLALFEVNHAIAVEAARIRREYGFRLPDAIQLATALHAKAQAFITNDRRLKGFKELPIVLLTEFRVRR